MNIIMSQFSHSGGEYVRGDVHTNSVESVWASLKRALYGIYIHVDPKHLPAYADEIRFKLHNGSVEKHLNERMHRLLSKSFNKRLTYEELISK